MNRTLDLARRHLGTAIGQREGLNAPHPGRRWDAYAVWVRDNVESFRTAEEVVEAAVSTIGFEYREAAFPSSEGITRRIIEIAREFPGTQPSLLATRESPLVRCGDVAQLQTGNVTGGISYMLLDLQRVHFAVSQFTGMPDSICEIGGGYGSPARVWLTSQFNPARRYEIVDLPESLYFAEVFLRTEFPGKRIAYFGQDEAEGAEIILYPAEQIDRIEIRSQVVVNTLSMAEMADAWIDAYRDFLDRGPARYFYSYNSAGRPLSDMRQHSNLYAPRLSREWGARLLRCGPNQRFPGGAVEAVYERVRDRAAWDSHYAALLETAAQQILDPEAYHRTLDALRYTGDAARASDFIDRCMAELAYQPKELLHLAQQCGRHDVAETLGAIRTSGAEGVIGNEVVERNYGSG